MVMAGEVVEGDLVYVIPLDDGTGSWVLMSSEYESVQKCEMPAVVEEEPASHAPTVVAGSGLGLMLLAGLL